MPPPSREEPAARTALTVEAARSSQKEKFPVPSKEKSLLKFKRIYPLEVK
jgi:hypothetical protein